ncbi:MAG: SDR family NAD(P)-dependent oxidoreductase [Pirellulales bacterium]|nr:SDR family NAD(P)-dependent oxidoreductase [Pirellulales bacterium]
MTERRQYAIVTGAASGLGRAFALRLARSGWHVAIGDINVPQAEETLRLIESHGGTGQVERLDVTQVGQWTALRARLEATWPRLDLLVNNAGVGAAGEVGEFPLDDWHWIVEVNLWSAIYGCHTLVDWLKQNPHGAHIINVASLAAFESAPPTAAYNVTKGGVMSLSETLYAQLLPHGVGVTVVCPSSFPTNISHTLRVTGRHWRDLLVQLEGQTGLTAEGVADQALRAMRAKRLYVVAPWSGRFRWYLKRLAPQRFLSGLSRHVYRWQAQHAQRASNE